MPKNDFLASWQSFFVKSIRTFCFPWCVSKITLGINMSIVIETTKGVFTVDLYIEQRPKGKFKFWCIIVRDRWRKFESWNIHKECGTNFFFQLCIIKVYQCSTCFFSHCSMQEFPQTLQSQVLQFEFVSFCSTQLHFSNWSRFGLKF